MESIRDALLKSFEPEFVIQIEPLGEENARALPVMTKIVQSRISGTHEAIVQEKDGKTVLFVRRKQ